VLVLVLILFRATIVELVEEMRAQDCTLDVERQD
jgi:hypothetical protein